MPAACPSRLITDPHERIAASPLHPSRFLLAIFALTIGCVQSKHGDGPNLPATPAGKRTAVRLIDERAGHGAPAMPGDRIRVEFTGTYANGVVWGHGPLTLVYGRGTYPNVVQRVRVGSVIRMQYVVDPNDTSSRLLSFQGDDWENEAYQLRHDRGQIIVEHRVKSVCRPMKVLFLKTGLGPIEMDLGCWRIPRPSPPNVDDRRATLERMVNRTESNEGAGMIVDPPVIPRRAADTARFTSDTGLHLAAREGRPEIVGWLIAHGRDVQAVDSHGFEPIHYAGYGQSEWEPFVPAFEQSYLDVMDTLLAHGAVVDARVRKGEPRAPTMPRDEFEGATALDLAGTDCADRLVAYLLSHGADPNAHAVNAAPPLTLAAVHGCPETIRLLLARGAKVDDQPQGGGTPLERLISVSAFHDGHIESAELLVKAGANTAVARQRLADRLADPKPGGFGFSNRPVGRQILKLLR